MHFIGFGLEPVEKSPNTIVVGRAVNDRFLLIPSESFKRDVDTDFFLFAASKQVLQLGSMVFQVSPWFDGPFFNGQGLIRYDQIQIDADGSAEAAARFAGSDGAVERK